MTGASGIDNVDDLLAVEGFDVFFIGPDDLTKNGRAAPRRASLSSLPYNNKF
jgi:2-keto-3-deoxy-L-rhamnonate aldolase RhmA